MKSYYDALVYVSTNLSVGYADIFARTPRGKAIGSALMTYGPAMTAGIFTPPAAPLDPSPAPSAMVVPAASSQAVLDKLDRILALLEANRTKATLPRG